jgi:pyruvate/2-oxoglutarate/acetoin dehydrogenase E1 component
MKYYNELKNAMQMLSNHKDTIFIGQSISYAGTGLYDTVAHIPPSKKYEFPIVENLQMGVSTGLALSGLIPVSLYPRWNFLLCAADQIVNHLDKMTLMSDGEYQPKVIIRVAVGSEYPINPQDQHKGDFTEAFKLMVKTIDIIKLNEPSEIIPAYEFALNRNDGKSTILVEVADFCKTK